MSDFWENKNVSVTGGNGFLGKHLIRLLSQKNPDFFLFLWSTEVCVRGQVIAKKATISMGKL